MNAYMEPPEIDFFFQEFHRISDELTAEFPDWSMSIQSTGEERSGDTLSSTAIACYFPSVPHLDGNLYQGSLEITVAIGGVGSDRMYFERADVEWFEQSMIIQELHGMADLLLTDSKPTATDANVKHYLANMPTLVDDARRIMSMLPWSP